MDLRVEKRDDIAVVSVPGKALDASNVDDFKAAIVPVIDGNPKVVLNIENLDFVDSSGLGAFLMCIRKLRSDGGEMKICGMTSPVKALFELVRMHRVCHVTETVDEAVEAFQN